jgi:S-adenosyl-L-methionine hydrolase (adenosine-forming)
MTIITLTSDFGMRDPYVGIMKGVILGIAPLARLVDLSHELPPQSIDMAAYTLRGAVPYFPAGTIHLAIIDPGVGSARRPLLVSTERALFVGPDNGLFSFALDEPGSQARVLDRELYWLPKISRTFHGRDIFAPVAAHLAAGLSPSKLGTMIHDPVRVLRREPARGPSGEISGHIIHVDRFGNLISNIPAPWLRGAGWTCEIAGHRVAGPSESYAAAQPGELVLLISSGDTAEIAVREGNAAERLGIGSGAPLILRTL